MISGGRSVIFAMTQLQLSASISDMDSERFGAYSTKGRQLTYFSVSWVTHAKWVTSAKFHT